MQNQNAKKMLEISNIHIFVWQIVSQIQSEIHL